MGLTAPPARLDIAAGALEALCRRHGVSRLSLFGSQLKGTARPDSDVDLLVEFEPGTSITLLDMACNAGASESGAQSGGRQQAQERVTDP